jgi:hypothetical protein
VSLVIFLFLLKTRTIKLCDQIIVDHFREGALNFLQRNKMCVLLNSKCVKSMFTMQL